MINKKSSNLTRKRRHYRIRKRINGTPEIPRLNVFRSNSHIYAQLIDDVNKVTLASASTMDKDISIKNGGNIDAAKVIGEAIGKKAADKKITQVVFDRGGYLYHGRVKALADAARETGLKF